MQLLVLVAEDDSVTRRGLIDVLSGEGFACLQAPDGAAAWQLFMQHRPNFVCLDVMMPEMNGYELCKLIRSVDAHVPIIFLTAKGEEIDKVVGLEIGADDYIVKPFGVKEVLARMRAVARRCLAMSAGPGTDSQTDPFRLHDLEVHPRQLRACRGDQWIDLSLREIKILQVLHEHAGQVVDRSQMMNYAWGSRISPQQPHARSTCLSTTQTHRSRSETSQHHSNGAWCGLSLRTAAVIESINS